MNKYEAVIGLEIHAELKTNSKMFCSCKNNPFSSKQNENICPVCLGMPGTLPVINYKAVNKTIDAGLYLNGKIANFTKWDRKNYFYPDLPKGYQISQFDLPIVTGGYIEIDGKKIRINRIHLEEDTGTSKHPEGRTQIDYSLLDYNRAGVPLMEMVTEPDLSSAKESKKFCQKFQIALRYLKISDADMEKGQMRCEANISVRIKGEKKFGTKVEVKNLNSFKAVEKSIEYEIKRQIEELENGNKIIQETRGWNDRKNQTYVMRTKETSADYRYFPEPDLPPIKISQEYIIKRKNQLPISLEKIVEKYIKEYDITETDVEILLTDNLKYQKFDEIIKNKNFDIKNSKKLANILINESGAINIKNEHLIELTELFQKNIISSKILKEIWSDVTQNISPKKIIEKKGIKQISGLGELEKIIGKIIKENPDAVSKIKNGQLGVMGFLVGQVMSVTHGKANPQIVNQILKKEIGL